MKLLPTETHRSQESPDYLTALPPELIHVICDHIFTTHNPDEGIEERAWIRGERGPPDEARFSATQSLDCLAATCKSLRRQIMRWGRHKHQSIAKRTPIRSVRLQNSANYLRGKEHGFLTWAEQHCNFCGKCTGESAILMSGTTCCWQCDETQWPGKITKKTAKMKYKLRDDQLVRRRDLTPTLVRLLSKHPGNLPKLRYGTRYEVDALTYYFLEKDVAAFAKLAHGDLRAHLAKKRVGTDYESQSPNKAAQDTVTASEEVFAEQGPAPESFSCSGPASSVDLVHGAESPEAHEEQGIEWLEESDRDHPYRMPFGHAWNRETS